MNLNKWLKINKRKEILNYKIFWYKCVPFVIAEVKNREWGRLEEIEKKEGKTLEILKQMYNSNGNWYIVEGLDYFWFHRQLFTKQKEEVLFNDSMHLQYNGKSDNEKFKMLKEHAQADMDSIWNKIFKKK